MKILWHSNAQWVGTGYGNQTKLAIESFQMAGHEVIVSAFYGLNGTPLNLNGIEITGGAKDVYGNDIIEAHQQFYKPDITIGLFDIWVLKDSVLSNLQNYYHWLPIDHDPIPPATESKVKLIGSDHVIAMSQFGSRMLDNAGLTGHTYIPHAVDSHHLYAVPRNEARAKIGLPQDVFVVGIVMANKGTPSRKAFDQNIRAYAQFQKHNPSAILYLHTDITGYMGENLFRIIELAEARYNVKLNYKFVTQYHYLNGRIGYSDMRYIYSACNVVLNASRGEGFGVPIIEAQACGTPVIVTDFTSMPELVIDGYAVPYSDIIFTEQDSYQVTPSTEAITAHLCEEASKDFDDKSRRYATMNETYSRYDVARVYEKYWQPFLDKVGASCLV